MTRPVLDEVDLEALMVLLGTDVERLLYAAGGHALGRDLGALCLIGETLAHQGRYQLSGSALRERGQRWYVEHAARLRDADPALFRTPSGDPRVALQVVAGRVLELLGPACDVTAAGLLAACVLQDHALSAAAPIRPDPARPAAAPVASRT